MARDTQQIITTFLATTRQITVEVAKRFNSDHCFSTAASLSYTTLLALVPFATVVFSALALLPVSEGWADVIEKFLFDNFVPATGETVRQYFHEFSTQAGKLTALGLLFLLFSSLTLLATIEDAFNAIWKVSKGRNWFQRVLIYWALLTMGPILIALSLSMSSALLSMSFLSDQAIVANFTSTLLRYLPSLLEFLAFMLFYQSIPNVEIRFTESLTGAVVATLLFELTKFGFGYWILHFNSYERIYGALATIPVFFVWIYLCWLVLLIGALICACMRSRRNRFPEEI